MSDMILNGIILSGLVISDDISSGAVRAEVGETLSGRKVIWEQTSNGGRSLDLVGGSDFGWLTRADLLELSAMASVVGASYALTLSSGSTMTVRFRNEDAPAVSGQPIVARPNQAEGDEYNDVIIKVMEV